MNVLYACFLGVYLATLAYCTYARLLDHLAGVI